MLRNFGNKKRFILKFVFIKIVCLRYTKIKPKLRFMVNKSVAAADNAILF